MQLNISLVFLILPITLWKGKKKREKRNQTIYNATKIQYSNCCILILSSFWSKPRSQCWKTSTLVSQSQVLLWDIPVVSVPWDVFCVLTEAKKTCPHRMKGLYSNGTEITITFPKQKMMCVTCSATTATLCYLTESMKLSNTYCERAFPKISSETWMRPTVILSSCFLKFWFNLFIWYT